MAPFGVGVVGIGDISDVYLTNLARFGDVVRVVGCAGRDLDKARRKAAQHGLPKAYATADELFADDEVEIVLDLATPDAHASLNLAALQAGKHVYFEKPLAATFAESRELLAVADAAGLRSAARRTRSWAGGCRRAAASSTTAGSATSSARARSS